MLSVDATVQEIIDVAQTAERFLRVLHLRQFQNTVHHDFDESQQAVGGLRFVIAREPQCMNDAPHTGPGVGLGVEIGNRLATGIIVLLEPGTKLGGIKIGDEGYP